MIIKNYVAFNSFVQGKSGKSSQSRNRPLIDVDVAGEIEQDAINFQNKLEKNATSAKSSTKTVSSTQPRRDPTGNIAFLISSTISIPTYWKYNSINSFSYMSIGNGNDKYIPTSMSRSLIDSSRTCAATFTCKRYNQSGVLVNSNSSVYKEFYASGDCKTNSPN